MTESRELRKMRGQFSVPDFSIDSNLNCPEAGRPAVGCEKLAKEQEHTTRTCAWRRIRELGRHGFSLPCSVYHTYTQATKEAQPATPAVVGLHGVQPRPLQPPEDYSACPQGTEFLEQ